MSQEEIDAITVSGGPKPQFAGNEVLTATNLNLATRHWVTTEVPGDHLGNDGDIAFVAGDAAPNSELPGIGGWADIEEVSGTYTKHVYEDWVAYQWTADTGYIKTTEGLIDLLIVNSGCMYNASRPDISSRGGAAERAVRFVEQKQYDIQVGKPSNTTWDGPQWFSRFGDLFLGNVTNGMNNGDAQPSSNVVINGAGVGQRTAGLGIMDDITGEYLGYGGGGGNNGTGQAGYKECEYDIVYGGGINPRPNSGGAAGQGKNPSHGITSNRAGAWGTVVIRVPAANAQNVTENFFRWISYATVENGVVTKVTKSPDNKPYTVSTNEIECDDPLVEEGYLYENGEFTAPEPDHSDEIAALTARLEELRNV